MTLPDYYQTLGVPPSASQDDIKIAHRELVKRYHPDIYWTSEDKARATEKLQAVNEAYAVLGNPDRRKSYDSHRAEQARRDEAAARQTAAKQKPAQPSSARRRRSDVRAATGTTPPPKAPRRPFQPRPRSRQEKKFFTVPRIVGAVGGAIVFALVAFSISREPATVPGWVLLENTQFEPALPASSKSSWNQLGGFASKTECVELLKSRVMSDRKEGSHVIFDESVGTVAITILLIDRTGVADTRPGDAGSPTQALLKMREGVSKRIRHYECRATRVPRESES